MFYISTFLIVVLSSTLVYAESLPMYQTLTDDIPQVGVQSEVYLGDAMVKKRVGQYEDCIIPDFSGSVTDMLGRKYVIKAHIPACLSRCCGRRDRCRSTSQFGEICYSRMMV